MVMEFKWLLFIRIAVMSVFLLLEGTTYACLEHERIALLQLKPFFNHYDELVDWDKPKGSDCCRWKGIECNTTTRRLVGLTLNSTRDSSEGWYLNASLFLPFVGLKRLYLRGNAIAGCIENEGFRWFSRLLNLGTLDLSWNPLGNDIMFQLSSLSSLKNLSLRSIDLEGELLHIQGLNNLTNLRYLDLNSNSIESILNKDETQLRLANLERLDLSANFFRNTLSFLEGLSGLKSIDIEQRFARLIIC
ncbi:receptor-like protein 56 [Hibiscus syriacus]|uniref:receptor-like protein 56 n=1 Tax=Hibiscus syriacus TaxID=106335 RepID=UPI001920B861|nr:receptor-like protein 56 [Hibiscus syriacus]